MSESMGERIHARRKELRLSLDALGKKAGLTGSFLWCLEKSRRGCSVENAERIADALGVRVAWLIGDQPERRPTAAKSLSEAAADIAPRCHACQKPLHRVHCTDGERRLCFACGRRAYQALIREPQCAYCGGPIPEGRRRRFCSDLCCRRESHASWCLRHPEAIKEIQRRCREKRRSVARV